MDVNRFSFGARLPSLLTSILQAQFVAIDLELSGIHSKLVSLRSARADGGKQTLQDRYRECKEAAEKYQVLQVGITCVEEDKAKGVYIARPYNFNLSPLVEFKVDLERDFTFQSGDHGFKFDNPIATGVPYLSRQEEVEVRQRARDRAERSKNISDLKLREDDTESLEFVRRLQPDYLNIAPLNFENQPQNNHGLNNFQKRLVHQLVRAEFPGFITLSKPTFIQVLAYNEAREASYRSGRENALNAQITKQTGLRWLVEAMLGGDLSGINPMDCAQNMTGESVFVNKEAITGQLQGLRDALLGHKTVLAGHNIFTDLINFYKTFIGDLPEKVEDFQVIIHQMFPMVVDTKYLATHEYGSTNLRSSLEDLEEDLRAQVFPTFKTHYDHSKYLSSSQVFSHEAGYDSFITAKVLVKLATRLEAEGDYVEVEMCPSSDDSFMTAPEYDDALPNLSADSPLRNATSMPSVKQPEGSVSTHPSQDVSLMDMDGDDFLEATGSSARPSKRKRRRVRKSSIQIESQFSHPTKFDLLGSLDDGGGSMEHERSVNTEQDGGDIPELLPRGDACTTTLVSDEPEMILMPPFETDFWRVYGNKLRVFGTKEEVFNLMA